MLAVFATTTVNAQVISNAPEQECFSAIPVCQQTYSQNNSYSGFGATQELNAVNQGCLSSAEKNDVWYVINVSTSGQLAFNITPNDLANDYDFAVWDITGGGCQTIYNGATPIGCNYSGVGGATGLSNTNTGSQWSPTVTVTAGQTLILNVSNFSSTQSGYTLDFGPSTASIFDNLPPHFASAFVRCGYVSDSLVITMSEPVTCASLSPTGSEFYIAPAAPGISIVSATAATCNGGANSSTIKYTLKFSGTLPSGNYTLHVQNGTDGNTLLDNCGNAQSPTDSVNFTMNPPTPPVIVQVDTPACISARIVFDRKVKCTTVALNGSDFTVTGPSPVQVTRAQRVSCDAFGLTDTVIIFFDKTIDLPGTYTLGFKTGTDGNGITDSCGLAAVAPFNFVVSDAGVTVTATPNILCEPGYVQLNASTNFPPSGSLFTCGLHQGPTNGTSNSFQVGNGNQSTNGSPLYTPFDGYWYNGRTQMLYKAADLKAAGLVGGPLTALRFNITQKGTTVPFNGFTIKMSCTTLTDLSGGFVAGLPVVYGPTSYTTVGGNNTFNLTTPYDWDSTQNLLVEICFSNNTFTQYDQVTYTSNANTTNCVYHRYQDAGPAGCTFTNSTGNGGLSSALPNITFTQVTPPPPGYGWLWTPSLYVADTTAPNTVAYVPSTQTYSIRLKDSFQCWRRGSATVIVSVRNPIAGPNNDTALCIGGSAKLMVSGGVRYEWFPTDGLSCTDCPDPIATPTQTTTYNAAIFDQYGCSDTLTNTVIVNPLPIVDAGRDTTVVYGRGIPLYVTGTPGRWYQWTPTANLSNPVAANPIASPLENTVYTVNVIDTNGCQSSDSVRVTVDMNEPLFVPSAFTPNGDRTNDLFRIANLSFQKLIEFKVFDRWGNLVCNTTDNNQGWDGSYNGVAQLTGVYQYLIRVSHPDGRIQTFKGDVTLIR